jgi:hypothetical protein
MVVLATGASLSAPLDLSSTIRPHYASRRTRPTRVSTLCGSNVNMHIERDEDVVNLFSRLPTRAGRFLAPALFCNASTRQRVSDAHLCADLIEAARANIS